MDEKNFHCQILELIDEGYTTEQIYQYLDISLSDFIEIFSYLKAESILEKYSLK